MQKKVFILTIIALTAGVVLLYFVLRQNQQYGQSLTISTSQTNTTAPNPNTVILPIDRSAPGVVGTYIAYNISGKIKSISAAKDTTQITLDLRNSTIPALDVNTSTILVQQMGSTQTTLPVTDLHIGDRITAGILFDIKTKKWSTRQIYKIITSQ